MCKTEEVVETQSPLLNPAIQSTGGKVIYPGNTTLLSLNLSGQSLTRHTFTFLWTCWCYHHSFPMLTGNKLTQQSLQMFLSSVACQGKRGLQYISLNVRFLYIYIYISYTCVWFHVRLFIKLFTFLYWFFFFLQRNSFPPDCEVFLKLQEMMSLKNPVNRTTSAQAEAEQGQAA